MDSFPTKWRLIGNNSVCGNAVNQDIVFLPRIRSKIAQKILGALDPLSAVGDDGITSRILKECVAELAHPSVSFANS